MSITKSEGTILQGMQFSNKFELNEYNLFNVNQQGRQKGGVASMQKTLLTAVLVNQ